MTITINKLTDADIPGLYREIRNSYGYLKELGWVATSFYQKYRHHYRQLIGSSTLLIFVIRVDSEIVGSVEIEDQGTCYFMGYWLGIRFRGKGTITKVIKDIIQNDLTVKKPLTARVDLKNAKSSAVLLRLDFKETSRDTEWIHYKKII